METHAPIHLLVDGDITYHRAARGKNQDGTPYDLDEAIASMQSHLGWLMEHLKAERMTVVVSGEDNFRKTLYAPYKSNRADADRPVLLEDLRAYLMLDYEAVSVPHLEADDVLGVMSTEPTDEQRVIVTIDKDLQQIPGFLFNQMHWQDGIKQVSQMDGDLFFYRQWMTGDSTDGYPGIPGVGPKKADKVIDKVFAQLGEGDDWRAILEETILATYHDYQLTHDYAVTQGRLARILRHGDYDAETGAISLWLPDNVGKGAW